MVAATADECVVDVGDELLRCTVRGALWQDRAKEDAAVVVVGDEVEVEIGPPGQGVISRVLPRRNALGRGREFQAYGARGRRRARRSVRRRSEQIIAANIDQALLVFAAANPRLNFNQVDRLLVEAVSEGLPAILCVNKTDLAEPGLSESLHRYDRVPVEVLMACAIAGQGVEALRDRLSGRTTVLWGPSGTGKSTLISAMWPGVSLKVGPVSSITGMGTHTTRSVQMVRVGEDTWVVDTPGWRHFTPRTVTREAVEAVLWDIAEYAACCRFPDCRHDKEPGCAVRAAVSEGILDRRRVDLFRELLDMAGP